MGDRMTAADAYIIDNTLEGDPVELSMLDLILDENYASEYDVTEQMLHKVGARNTRLSSKQEYELLLRIASHGKVWLVNSLPADVRTVHITRRLSAGDEGYKTDCYIIARYQQILQEAGMLETAENSILEEASKQGIFDGVLEFMKNMLLHAKEYDYLYDATQPVLIYTGSDVCHNVLNEFAYSMGEALEQQYVPVEYFDVERQQAEVAQRLLHRRFRAILGVQTYFFSIYLEQNHCYLHDYIHGPRYNMILDHPIWMREHLAIGLDNYHVLTHDRDYKRFVELHYADVQSCSILPPAGRETTLPNTEKKYDISFVGTYSDYREKMKAIEQGPTEIRHIAEKYLEELISHPNLCAEEAWRQTLLQEDLPLSEDEYMNLLFRMRPVCFGAAYYMREKVLESILQSGIEIHVFGDSWAGSCLSRYANLICHGNVTTDESRTVMSQSKITFNIMTGHKDGFTERIANGMLNHSLVLTDRTRYLEEHFENQEEIVFYELAELEKLPEIIRGILADDERRERIAEKGYHRAKQEHTWANRAKDFMRIIR